jgi:hypothetical protein
MDARSWERRYKMLVECNLYVACTAVLAIVWHAWLASAFDADARSHTWTITIGLAVVPGAFISAPFASMAADTIVHRISHREFLRRRQAEIEPD